MSSKQTPIPFGFNRYALLALVALKCLIDGPVCLNWPPIRSMYVRENVYAWLCDDADSCPAQRKALALLAMLGQTLMFVGSVVGGYVVDRFGPKTATVTGSLLFILHYLFIALSSESVQMYIPAYICQGFGIEMSYFGVLHVAHLFPRNRAFAMSILGASRSMAMAYSITQRSLAEVTSLRITNLLCMSLSAVVGVAAALAVPSKPFIMVDSSSSTCSTAASSATCSHQDLSALQIEYDWRAKAMKPVYWAWVCFFSVAFSRYTFFGVSLQDQMPEAVRAYSIMSPLSFVPCPILGYLGDKAGMLWVLTWLNIVGTTMYICLLVPSSTVTRWLAVMSASCVASFLASQNYCYIGKTYPGQIAGRLAGIAMLMAGLVSLINTPLYNWSIDRGSFVFIDIIWLSLSLGLFGCIALMMMISSSQSSIKEHLIV